VHSEPAPTDRHEIRFSFDRGLIGAAYRPMFVLRGVLFFALIGVMVLVNWVLAGQIPHLLVLAIVAVSIAVPVRLWQVWSQSVARTHALWTKQAPDGTIRLRLADDGFQVVLGTGSMRYSWEGLRKLHRRSKVWCLEVVKHTSVLFPPDAASAEAKGYVVERCRAAGVKV
jgi:hypothetical protein